MTPARPQARTLALIVVALVAVLVVSSASSSWAESSDPERENLIDAALNGTLTTAQRHELIASHRELAGALPDASLSTTTFHETVPKLVAPSTGQRILGHRALVRCKTSSAVHRERSTLGFTLYRFHHSVRMCYDGSTVTSVSERRSWITDVDPTVDYQGLIGDWVNGVGRSSATSFAEGHTEHCVFKVGCYANQYPYIRMTLRGSGSNTYESGR